MIFKRDDLLKFVMPLSIDEGQDLCRNLGQCPRLGEHLHKILTSALQELVVDGDGGDPPMSEDGMAD